MKLKKYYSLLFSGLIIISLSGQTFFTDTEILSKIKKEGFENSDIPELSFLLTDYTGSRLTGSYGNNRGNKTARNKMVEYGIQDVIIDTACDFVSGGWDNKKTYAAMITPYYHQLVVNPVAWTGSTNGKVKSEVILFDVNNYGDFDRYIDQIEGKIILLPATLENKLNFERMRTRKMGKFSDQELKELTLPEPPSQTGNGITDTSFSELRNSIYKFLEKEKVAVIINESGSALINVPASEGVSYIYGDTEPVPQLNMSVESFGIMERLLRRNQYVEMEVEVQNIFTSSPYVYNIIGDISGTDPGKKDEIVLIGAHIDSWHGGTGAGDNAAGCIVMMEAMRILSSQDIKPGRTIRIALWGGEEQGFLGSRGYVSKYLVDPKTREPKPGYDNFSVYFNMDNASGKFRGIYMQGNEFVRPIFEEWLKLLTDMGCSTLSPRNYGNTDHIAFDEVNLPGFSFIQDRDENGGAHHTTADTYERLNVGNLKHNAVIMAFLAYKASIFNEKIPGKNR